MELIKNLKRIKKREYMNEHQGVFYFFWGIVFFISTIFFGDLMYLLRLLPFGMALIFVGLGFMGKYEEERNILMEYDLQKFIDDKVFSIAALGFVLGLPAWIYLFLLRILQYGLDFWDLYIHAILLFIIFGYVKLLAERIKACFGGKWRSCPCCGEEYHTSEGLFTHILICKENPKSENYKDKTGHLEKELQTAYKEIFKLKKRVEVLENR